jgi:hypothetical protein
MMIRTLRNICRVLVRGSEGKRLLGESRRRWVDNIKMDVKEIECKGVDWVNVD